MKLRKERLVESLEIRNKVYEMIEKCGFRFSDNFNDLYKVKNGEVRRLKGKFLKLVEGGVDFIDDKDYDNVVDLMKMLLNDLEFNGGYKVNISKKGMYYGSNWDRDIVCIIKISWEN